MRIAEIYKMLEYRNGTHHIVNERGEEIILVRVVGRGFTVKKSIDDDSFDCADYNELGFLECKYTQT